MEANLGLGIDVSLAILTAFYLVKLLFEESSLRRSLGGDFQGGSFLKKSLHNQHVFTRQAHA